ncbi:MAG: leucine-rich repeat protein [Clostridiales bacterium]|nr:leucine-rich repeat protein [Clostridiales bacterium]
MHTKKYIRLLFAFICVCFFITFYHQTAFADSFTEGYLTYMENEDGTLTITGYDRSKHEEPYNLQISNQVNGKTVTAIAQKVFQKQTFQSLFIDNDISIGAYAFEGANICGVPQFGSDNTGTIEIGRYAFASAVFSTPVHFNANLSISDYAFFNTNIRLVIQTNSIISHIGKSAFERSEYMSGINYSSLIYLGERAFYQCDSTMESFTISSTLKTMYSSSLPPYLNIYIDEGVTDVSTFGLEQISNAFFYVGPESPVIPYLSANNCSFTVTEVANSGVTYPKPIPNQIIYEDNCTLKVTGDTTATLLKYEFEGECLYVDNLPQIDYHGYPLTINEIYKTAFRTQSCPYMTEVVYGKNIKKIAYDTFVDNSIITKITLSDAITEIERGAISNIDSLTIEIPAGITTVSNFYFCDLTNVVFQVSENSPVVQELVDMNLIIQFPGGKPITPGSPEYPEKSDKPSSGDNIKITTETTTENNTEIPTEATTEKSTEILVPGSSSNEVSTNETPTTVPPSTETFADETSTSASSNHTRPTKGTTFLIQKASYLVTGKNSITYLKPINKKITKLTIPAFISYNGYTFKVTKIEKNACCQCTNLKTVTIGSNVTSIGDSAFAKCSRLKSITFGKNVKKLGKKVLYYDTKLEMIKFQGTKLHSIGKQTFRKVPKNVSIIVPNSKVSKYKHLINNAK